MRSITDRISLAGGHVSGTIACNRISSIFRQVAMKTTFRPGKTVPVYRLLSALLFVLSIAPPPSFAQAPTPLPLAVTSQQIDEWVKMLRSGAEIPPEAVKVLKAHPEIWEQLPPEVKEKLKGKGAEGEAAKAPAAPEGAPSSLPAYDWRTSVYVGGLFSSRLYEAEVGTLTHFGHDVFAPRPGGAAVLQNIPVSPTYVVGPGDEVVVKLWGRMEGTHRMTVDREGKIYLPKIGSLYVAGKTFSELKSFIRAKVGTTAEVSSDVSIGQLKGIGVSVVGEVRSPGWHNVSSQHTVLQALYLAGGVKDIGSLRRIELHRPTLLRGGKVVEQIDLYDFLLKGETRADVRLLQGDTIFVPVVGKLVALAGEVRRPAIYELRDEKSLLDLVAMGGGFAPTAYKKRVQVERLEGNVAKIVLDVNAEEIEKNARTFELSDGDIVRVLPIVLADVNAVTLAGNVARPGKYELKDGMTVGTLLPDELSFLPDTYFDYALLTRLIPPDMRKEIIPVNLREIVLEKKEGADIELRPYDLLTVYSRSAFRDVPKVTVSGEVRNPGTLELKKGARVSDLVQLAGDLTKDAYLDQAEIVRLDEKRIMQTIYIDLGKAMAGEEKDNLILKDEDQLFIRRIPVEAGKARVTVAGEVRFPGLYVLREGEHLSSLIARAGGFTSDAYLQAATFTRVSTQMTQQEAIDRLIEDLELEVAQKSQEIAGILDKEDLEANKQLLAARRSLVAQLKKARAKGRVIIRLAEADKLKGTSADIPLEDGDQLEVPKKTNVVNVVGRVYNPTGVVYDPENDRLGHYLSLVGGPTESADRDHIFLIRANGSVVTRDNVQSGFFVFGEKGLMSAKVEPGDSIVVPEKLIQVRLMKDVKDITQIMFQIAVTAGVLIAAF
jgi:protein involved in polysaccharide export with SLBB domain